RRNERALIDSVPTVFLVETTTERLGQHACFALATQLGFEAVGGGDQFIAKFQVIVPARVVEATVFEGGAHAAARLAQMAAIAEAAVLDEHLDIAELVAIEGLLAGQLDLAHAWRVDQAAATRQLDQ